MNLTLEWAKSADAPELMGIHNRGFAHDLARYGECPGIIPDEEAIVRRIRRGFYYKIVAAGHIVGIAHVHIRPGAEFYLGALCIDPAFQGRHIGSRTLELLEQRHPHAAFWSLITPADNPISRHVYERAGYRCVGYERHSEALTLARYEKRGRSQEGQPVETD